VQAHLGSAVGRFLTRSEFAPPHRPAGAQNWLMSLRGVTADQAALAAPPAKIGKTYAGTRSTETDRCEAGRAAARRHCAGETYRHSCDTSGTSLGHSLISIGRGMVATLATWVALAQARHSVSECVERVYLPGERSGVSWLGCLPVGSSWLNSGARQRVWRGNYRFASRPPLQRLVRCRL